MMSVHKSQLSIVWPSVRDQPLPVGVNRMKLPYLQVLATVVGFVHINVQFEVRLEEKAIPNDVYVRNR